MTVMPSAADGIRADDGDAGVGAGAGIPVIVPVVGRVVNVTGGVVG